MLSANEPATSSSVISITGQIHACRLCPRMCGVDRTLHKGYCQCPPHLLAARAALHQWEEPCISGFRGSGAVFFSGCTLRCCFCQNYEISHPSPSAAPFGKALTSRQLADVFLSLQDQGAHNINLVTATPYLPWILPALDLVRDQLSIPVVYNCGGYERVETIRALKDYVDIWLPDLKYSDSEKSARYSGAPDYFQTASQAILQMARQTGPPVFHTETSPQGVSIPVMDRGIILRHLVLPGSRTDSIRLLHWIADTLPRDCLLSLMSQYTPCGRLDHYPELNRRITTYEYESVLETALELGLEQGFLQKKSSATKKYTPHFNLEGLP